MGNSTLYRGPVDPANWFGIRKGFPNLGYIQVGGDGGQRWGGDALRSEHSGAEHP